ncbi:24858_t:CDS:2, partial [Racocetra persica]
EDDEDCSSNIGRQRRYLCDCNSVNQSLVAVLGKKVKGTKRKFEYTVPKKVGPPGDSYFLIFSQVLDEQEYTSYSGHFSIKGVNGPSPSPSLPNNTDSYPSYPSASSSSLNIMQIKSQVLLLDLMENW